MDVNMTDNSVRISRKSTFVSVIAWIYIVIGGLATFIGLLEFIVLQFLMPENTRAGLMSQMDQARSYPEPLRFIFAHIDFFMVFLILVSAVIFFSAIALLKRKNWARILFIVLMIISALWNIIGLSFRFLLGGAGESAAPAEFQGLLSVIDVFSIVLAVGMTLFFIIATIKLCSHGVRIEFGVPESSISHG